MKKISLHKIFRIIIYFELIIFALISLYGLRYTFLNLTYLDEFSFLENMRGFVKYFTSSDYWTELFWYDFKDFSPYFIAVALAGLTYFALKFDKNKDK